MDLIKVGVIGVGIQFRNLHMPNYVMGLVPGKVVAVADINEESAEEIAQKCGADYWFTDYKELINLKDIDAIDICTPPWTHWYMAVEAAQAGKHVLVEKPMCIKVEQADKMIAAAEKAGVNLQVAYLLRFNPLYLKLKHFLEEKTFGELHVVYECQIGWASPHALFGEKEVRPWLYIKEKSGGMLIEQAIHTLDAWLWLYGPVDTVYARVSHIPLGGMYPPPEKAVENNAVVIANFKNGGTGMLIKSWTSQLTHHGKGLIGSEGSAKIEEEQLIWKLHSAREIETYTLSAPAEDEIYRRWLSDPEISGIPLDARRIRYWDFFSKGKSIERWLRCIKREETPTTSGKVGRAGVELAEAIYRSSKIGEIVKIS